MASHSDAMHWVQIYKGIATKWFDKLFGKRVAW